MNVDFYTFSKRINSTAQPTGGASYSCVLKSASSVTAPRVSLVWGGSGNPSAYNYAYIGDYGRYYWVSNWTFSDRQWSADLSVDVLATYKTEIGGATKYVLRAASEENVDAVDSLYPSTSDYDYIELDPDSFDWTEYGLGTGTYVITVVGSKNASGNNDNVAQYWVNGTSLQKLIENTVDAAETAAQNLSANNAWDALMEIARLPLLLSTDISHYLKNVMWFPFAFPAGSASSNVYLGPYKVYQTAHQLTNCVKVTTFNFNVSGIVPNTARKWEYMAPYASYYINFPPFGVIPLDPADVVNVSAIQCDVRIDSMSGIGYLKVLASDGLSELRTIAVRSAQVGVTVPYGGWAPNYAGAITGISGIIAAATAEGAYQKFMLPAAIGSAVAGSGYQGYTSGTCGAGAGVGQLPHLYGRVLHHVDPDPVERGYPLCTTKQISLLSGYVQCMDGDIPAAATSAELQQIQSYLTGGFFYE